MRDLIHAATQMLNGRLRNAWTEDAGLSVYMRHGIHRVDDHVVDCLDIANVVANTRGTGAFTKFLDEMEILVANHATVKHIYIESIVNFRLQCFLARRGYSDVILGNHKRILVSPNMYKRFGA